MRRRPIDPSNQPTAWPNMVGAEALSLPATPIIRVSAAVAERLSSVNCGRDCHAAHNSRGAILSVCIHALRRNGSDVTSSADLSSLRPRNRDCRNMPSRGHSVNAISATKRGSTQCTPRAERPFGSQTVLSLRSIVSGVPEPL